VKDFRPQAIGGATLVFTPTNPASLSDGTLMLPKEVRVTAASDGSFSTSLTYYSSTNPRTAYRLRIEWLDSAGNYTSTEEIPWLVVVTGSGLLTDMFANVEAGKLLTKGEKGDPGDSVMQDAFDALEARLPQPGAKDELRIVDLNGKEALGVAANGDVLAAGSTFRAADGFRVTDANGYVALEVDPAGRTYIYDPAFSTGGTSSAVDTLHVFLAAGQSNMSGRGLPIGGEVKDPRILQFGATRRVLEPATVPLDMHDAASGISPATTFAQNYLKTQPANVGVLIIPAAHGATGFTTSTTTLTWSPNVATDPALDLPALAVAQTLEGIEAARAAGYTVATKGILWHQGEQNGSTSQSTYEGLLDGLISYFRTSLGGATLPFVVGQMSIVFMEESGLPRENVNRAHSGTPSRVAYTGFAPSLRGATNDGDTTHFSKVGVEYLGKTYLAGYWQALGNNQSAAPQPPSNVTASKSGTTLTVQWSGAPESLAKSETFDLATSSAAYNWAAPQSHATGYRVETKTGAGAWTTVTRAWGMALTETVTVTAGTTQVRVTALNGAAESSPVTVTAVGA
jgi:hypothetical protein